MARRLWKSRGAEHSTACLSGTAAEGVAGPPQGSRASACSLPPTGGQILAEQLGTPSTPRPELRLQAGAGMASPLCSRCLCTDRGAVQVPEEGTQATPKDGSIEEFIIEVKENEHSNSHSHCMTKKSRPH